jgi:hypothetical protein
MLHRSARNYVLAICLAAVARSSTSGRMSGFERVGAVAFKTLVGALSLTAGRQCKA